MYIICILKMKRRHYCKTAVPMVHCCRVVDAREQQRFSPEATVRIGVLWLFPLRSPSTAVGVTELGVLMDWIAVGKSVFFKRRCSKQSNVRRWHLGWRRFSTGLYCRRGSSEAAMF